MSKAAFLLSSISVILMPIALAADFSPNDFSNDFDIGVGGGRGWWQTTSIVSEIVQDTTGLAITFIGATIIAVAFVMLLVVWYVKETR